MNSCEFVMPDLCSFIVEVYLLKMVKFVGIFLDECFLKLINKIPI